MTQQSSSKKKPKSSVEVPSKKKSKSSVDGPSKKKSKSSAEGPVVVEEEKQSPKPKKMGSEIDDIFAGKKRKRPETEKKATPDKVAAKPHEYGRIVKNGYSKASKDNTAPVHAFRPRKKTAEGLTIYTEEELGIAKPEAGGTRLCPFDCDCCF